jgi:hypothetical protein
MDLRKRPACGGPRRLSVPPGLGQKDLGRRRCRLSRRVRDWPCSRLFPPARRRGFLRDFCAPLRVHHGESLRNPGAAAAPSQRNRGPIFFLASHSRYWQRTIGAQRLPPSVLIAVSGYHLMRLLGTISAYKFIPSLLTAIAPAGRHRAGYPAKAKRSKAFLPGLLIAISGYHSMRAAATITGYKIFNRTQDLRLHAPWRRLCPQRASSHRGPHAIMRGTRTSPAPGSERNNAPSGWSAE